MSIYLRSRLIQAARLHKDFSVELMTLEKVLASATMDKDAGRYLRAWTRSKRLLSFLSAAHDFVEFKDGKALFGPIFMGVDHQKGDYLLPLLIQHNINAREKL